MVIFLVLGVIAGLFCGYLLMHEGPLEYVLDWIFHKADHFQTPIVIFGWIAMLAIIAGIGIGLWKLSTVV